MLYPIAQSVWLVCVEKVKKMPLQRHCPLSSSFTTMEKQNHFAARASSYQNFNVSKTSSPRAVVCVTSIIDLNFELCHTLIHSLLVQPTTPQRANKTPYLQGTGAPRHYPHTLIEHVKMSRTVLF
jgi:hypothetical protein